MKFIHRFIIWLTLLLDWSGGVFDIVRPVQCALDVENNTEPTERRAAVRCIEKCLMEPLGFLRVMVYSIQDNDTDAGYMKYLFGCGDVNGGQPDNPLSEEDRVHLREGYYLQIPGRTHDKTHCWVNVGDRYVFGFGGLPVQWKARITKARREGLILSARIVYRAMRLNGDLRTTRKQLNEAIQKGITDKLTSLPNRRWIEENLPSIIKSFNNGKHGLIVGMLDIDNFKKVNDTYGHAAGDRALREISEVIQACLKKGEFIARYGGEEFLLNLNDVDRLEEIRSAVEAMAINLREIEEPLRCTVSIGYIHLTEEHRGLELTPDDLKRWADTGLYEAKRQGRNRVINTRVATA